MILPDIIWNALSGLPAYSHLTPAATGFVLSHLHSWVPSDATVRDQVALSRQAEIERANKGLQVLLQRALTNLEPADLRGSPPSKPDLISDWTVQLLSTLDRLSALERLRRIAHYCTSVLMFSLLPPLLLTFLGFVGPSLAPWLSLLTLVLLILQFALAFKLRQISHQLVTFRNE